MIDPIRDRYPKRRTVVFLMMIAMSTTIVAPPDIAMCQGGDEPALSSGESSIDPPTTDLTVEVTANYNNTEFLLEDARITVDSREESPTTKTTDASGKAVFSSLHRATVTITVNAHDLVFETVNVDLTEERQTKAITIPWPLGRLEITVSGLDTDVAPVPNCQIQIRAIDGSSHLLPETDSDGVVIAGNLPLGEVKITAIATGWNTEWQKFQLWKATDSLEIKLTRQIPPALQPTHDTPPN